MRKVKTGVWVAALVCGVLLISLVGFLGHRSRDEEKRGITGEVGGTSVTGGVRTERGGGQREQTQMTQERASSVQKKAPDRRPASAKPRVPRLPAKIGLQLSPDRPRLGETAKLTFTITTLQDEPKLKVWFRPLKGVAVVGGDKEVYCSMTKGETRRFSTDIKLLERYIHVRALAGRPWRTKTGEEKVGYRNGRSLRRVIVDEETGQFGTIDEKLAKGPEYRYDVGGGIIYPPGEYRGSGKHAREMIERLKRIEPKLTDWEAVYLHRDALRLLWGGVDATEDERIKLLLDEGWLGQHRKSGKVKEKWLEELINRKVLEQKKSKSEEEGRLTPKEGGPTAPPNLVDTHFLGQWVYKKHEYDTLNGLLESTHDVPIRRAKVWIWAYWTGQSRRRLWPPAVTDENGNFYVMTTDIPWNATNVKAAPVMYTWGPELLGPEAYMVRVSDPNPRTTFADTADTTIWWLRESDSPLFHPLEPGDTLNFGTVFPDTLGAMGVHQPRSGAANIYETVLHAYEYVVPSTTPDTLGTVRALWEPDFVPPDDTTSYYSPWGDTIFVLGLDYIDTDEWDDGTLIHEYGHHVMYHCAEMPPNQDTIRPYWWVSDDSFANTAYTEGWPDFFQAAVRDSVYYVDTQYGIGGGSAFWLSLENPWLCSDVDTDSFEGGPWCEGAVAGALWDIYDSADEDTYPVYPAPGWPDTNLADTLSLGFDEIENIFDDYDPKDIPPDTIKRCWTIYHFITGWRSPQYNYGHETGMRPIFVHHRIDWDTRPGDPGGLNVIFHPVLWAAHLTWSPPSSKQAPIAGYCVYRKEFGDTLFDRVAEPSETSYTDTSVVTGLTYFYTVTAFDTLGIESDTSNNEWVWIPFSSDTVVATAFNNADKIAVDSNNVHLVFVSEGKICYGLSENQAMSWSSPDTLGEGETPGLSLDIQGNPHVVWIGPDKGGSRYIYYARYDTDWHVDILFCPGGSPGKGLPLVRPYLPSLAVDPSGYGHVVWEERWITVPVDWRLEYAKFKTQNPDSIVVEQVDHTAMEDWYGSPSIALDCLNRPYVVYRRGSKGEIYYTMKDTAWTAPDSISESPSITSSWPCLDFCDSTLSAVWIEGDSSPAPDIYYRCRELDTSWDTIEHVIPTLDFSAFPVIVAGTYVARAESSTAGPDYDWDIHGARRKSDGTWEQLGGFSTSGDVNSRYPNVAFAQDADTGYLYVAWTEGDSAPFATMVRRFEVPRVSGFEKGVRAGVEEEFLFIPRVFALSQNYPNPCGQFTIINYQLPKPSHTSLKIYDVAGRLVRTLVDERKKAGYYLARWDAKDSAGEKVASGIYFYRLSAYPEQRRGACDPALSPAEGSRGAGYFRASKKMVVLR